MATVAGVKPAECREQIAVNVYFECVFVCMSLCVSACMSTCRCICARLAHTAKQVPVEKNFSGGGWRMEQKTLERSLKLKCMVLVSHMSITLKKKTHTI